MKNQYEIKVQTLKKQSTIYPKSIPNSDQIVRSFCLRFWTNIHSILPPKSVQEPPKIDPETHPESPRFENPSKSLQKSIQRPPQSLQDTTQAPKASQRLPKSLLRPLNDLPESDFGSLFHPKSSLRTTIFETGV